ncbi:MAG: C69 family dipeptidase [Prevotellaceae bacterium]|jgi:dipeptidase|nr:C69 family dipeptidase [Prevotellaceae bacterium]
MKKIVFLLTMALFLARPQAEACTNILVTKGASKDGSTMVTYSADSHQLYGELYFFPAAIYPKGTMMKVIEWDTGKYLGEIPQAEQTYSVIGNMNEHQLLIGETTFGGLSQMRDPNGGIDYGSLIYISLQRAKTAREAIEVMANLVATFGYCSSGESISIADPNEVWIFEIMPKIPKIVKGVNVNKGAVWVALRVPDGYVCAHANQARITTFPFDDPDNCLFAPDVISHARENNLYTGADKDFSFSDVYAPLDFGAMRGCEARVWAAFNHITTGMEVYTDYAMGHNPNNRMPLWVKPTNKLSVKEVADLMRDHYEGTILDMRLDPGAGGNTLPYRWRPMTFTFEGNSYQNERAIATQQTGWWYVGQCRSWLPDAIGGILWFGVDDAGTSALTPIYCSTQTVPECVKVGNGSMLEYSTTSLFWITNRIAQFAYLRYDEIGAETRSVVDAWENKKMNEVLAVDEAAKILYAQNPQSAIDFITDYSVNTAQSLFNQWVKLDQYLMIKYIDGNTKQQNPDGSFKNNGHDPQIPARVINQGYSEIWKETVAKSNRGEVLRVRD